MPTKKARKKLASVPPHSRVWEEQAPALCAGAVVGINNPVVMAGADWLIELGLLKPNECIHLICDGSSWIQVGT
jgi:hypothetical protein